MDGRSFDELTRRLGAGASRRTVVRGLLAGVAAGIGLGGRARAVTCGTVGIACDPADDTCCTDFACNPQTNNCQLQCGDIAATCASDADCCSVYQCVSGRCGFEPDCAFESCTTTEECCQNQYGTVVCEEGQCVLGCSQYGSGCQNADDCCDPTQQCIEFAGIRRCGYCDTEGQPCTQYSCCQGLFCNQSGVCEPFGGTCAEQGGECAADGDCCQGLSCTESGCAPLCSPAGEGCMKDADCCEGLVCVDDICGVPEPECGPAGASCNVDHDCCGELICDGGTCATVPEPPVEEPSPTPMPTDDPLPAPESSSPPASGGGTTLPSTGSGAAGGDGVPVALLGAAAAALIAGAGLRRSRSTDAE